VLWWAVVINARGYTDLLFGAQSGSVINQVYDHLCRLVWAAPAFALLWRYAGDVPVTRGVLFKNKPSIKPFLISFSVITLYDIGAMFVLHAGIWINPEFGFLKHFTMFIMVAFVEELVYRGWGLNALSGFISERKANLISNAFFVLLHLPAHVIRFYKVGVFPAASIVTQCLMVFILGWLFGYLFTRGKSLWSPMILHFWSDFLSVIVIA
jgi:membrane protease YdiL (CAAX protease family)